MTKTTKFTVEVVDGKVWGRLSRSSGDPEEAPINEVLRWIVEQINFGNFLWRPDGHGDVTSLVIGSAAAADATDVTIEAVKEKVERRLGSVNFAGVFARAREGGIEPSGTVLAEEIRMNATAGGYGNTEIHYAFELLDILARIRAHSFVFTSPPIKGVASPEVAVLLREATRAYLFDLPRSCVAFCRALLEEALKDRVNATELLNEQYHTKRGELECLIRIGTRRGLLTAKLSKQATAIRKAGNWALHPRGKRKLADEDVWGVLLDTRAIVEALSNSHAKTTRG